jgi:HSP20 family protein
MHAGSAAPRPEANARPRYGAPIGAAVHGYTPYFDVKQVGVDLVFTADLPGVDADDLSVTLAADLLRVTGVRNQAVEGETYCLYERDHGPFSRTFKIAGEIDRARVEVRLDRGVLTVVVPKAAAPAKTASRRRPGSRAA